MHNNKLFMIEVSVVYLLECLVYDSLTGTFVWLRRPREHFSTKDKWHKWNAQYAGRPAGSLCANGYRNIRLRIEGKKYALFCHRLALAISMGVWPEFEIDHKNGVRHDNRLVNLRVATTGDNSQNLALRSNNTSGLTGVAWDKTKRKWMASIAVSGRSYHLGRFPTRELAHAAYLEAKERLHIFNPVPRVA